MRLLVDAHVFDGKFQGTRTYIEGIYKELIKKKDIEFYFAAQNLENLSKVFGIHPNVHYVQLKEGGSVNRLVFQWHQIVKKHSIDWAHYQYISPLKKCCNEIVTLHDLLFLDMPEYFPLSYRLKNKYFFRRSAKRADILLTVSSFSKGEIVQHFNISPEKIYITPNSVLPADENLSLPDVKSKWGMNKFILSVGRYEPRKNLAMLMRAFSELELHTKGYKLVLIGSKDIENKEVYNFYENADANLKSAIIMDKVSFVELVSLYKNADLFVFPSLGEGFGIPPLEAMVYGCPLICSNVTAMKEFELPDEITFNPKDLNDLKRKMVSVLSSEKQHINYDSIIDKYTWQNSADILYKSINSYTSKQ